MFKNEFFRIEGMYHLHRDNLDNASEIKFINIDA